MSSIDAALIATRFVHFTSVLGLFGAVFFGAYAGAAGPAVAPAMRRGLVAAAVLAGISGILWLMLEAASFADAWPAAIDLEAVGAVLNETSFGRVWSARLAIAILCLGLALVPLGRGRDLCLGLAAALLAGSLGLTGHAAMEVGVPGLLHRANDAGHLLAVGAWLGGLWPLAFCLRREPALAALALRRFSDVGIGMVLLILISGILNSWFLVGSWAALWHSDYGHLLLLKLALVATMIGLALLNRLVLLARIASPAALRHLLRNVLAEQALGLAILLVVSLLGTMPPAGDGMP